MCLHMSLHNSVCMTCLIDDGTPDLITSLFDLAKLFMQALLSILAMYECICIIIIIEMQYNDRQITIKQYGRTEIHNTIFRFCKFQLR